MRIAISLPQKLADRLTELCREKGISRAEAMRRALDRYLADQRGREDVFGMWRERATDGLAHERQLRKEWREARTDRR